MRDLRIYIQDLNSFFALSLVGCLFLHTWTMLSKYTRFFLCPQRTSDPQFTIFSAHAPHLSLTASKPLSWPSYLACLPPSHFVFFFFQKQALYLCIQSLLPGMPLPGFFKLLIPAVRNTCDNTTQYPQVHGVMWAVSGLSKQWLTTPCSCST